MERSARAERSMRPRHAVTLLAVGPADEDLSCLRSICSAVGWTLHEASTLDEALDRLNQNPVPVVLCKRDLPDGNWSGLLDVTQNCYKPAKLIVWSRHADNFLWAEVLNRGGCDVLAAPFRVVEVAHAVRMAVSRWQRERGPQRPRLEELASAAYER